MFINFREINRAEKLLQFYIFLWNFILIAKSSIEFNTI